MKRVLLLNASYEALNFISDERAFRLLLKGRAEVVSNIHGNRSIWKDIYFQTTRQKFEVPATVRLLTRINRKWKPPRFRKKVLFNRDQWKCQYCNLKLLWNTATIDHVVPSSRGGVTSWTNCVAACKPCNKTKANRTPDEAGLKLAKVPTEPNALHFWDLTKSNSWHIDWSYFLGHE
jgi:5-methylcytosine-specific restriction endonuclease McrA